MKVFLICENVDLGYHVEAAYADEAVAESKCVELNAKFKVEKIKGLLSGCNYTLKQAEEYVRLFQAQYFVEEHEVMRGDK